VDRHGRVGARRRRRRVRAPLPAGRDVAPRRRPPGTGLPQPPRGRLRRQEARPGGAARRRAPPGAERRRLGSEAGAPRAGRSGDGAA
jgi:hypothetical protein